ncbi:MAG: hypothetical protein JWN82_152 [Candidatus Saccharibacteria bacterium]|nr:hypothetical protein [Candidatus Saccharibacteria bacterium]
MMIALAAAGLIIVIAVIVLIVSVAHHRAPKQSPHEKLEAQAKSSAENIFDDQFREELRNRGRLHFEKIIGENAMFLQQDLRLTTSQLNEYMKTEITKKLQDEFTKYEQSIMDAKQLAVDSIQKTNIVIEEQRKTLSAQLNSQLEAEKAGLIGRFEEDMADIINHYVLAAVGNQIDLSDQLEYIMGELEANKQAMSEDIKNGA